jgi:hypothetical protein
MYNVELNASIRYIATVSFIEDEENCQYFDFVVKQGEWEFGGRKLYLYLHLHIVHTHDRFNSCFLDLQF